MFLVLSRSGASGSFFISFLPSPELAFPLPFNISGIWPANNINGTVSDYLWGTFNAVLEYVDHYERDEGIGISWSLLGSGAVLKRKAFGLAIEYLQHENPDGAPQ